jgi:hypothetical protein
MATKSYYLRFGSGNPSSYSGLAPTFIVWRNAAGVTTSPSIAEVSTTGIYTFTYEINGTVAFVADGATTGLATADRYIAGALDISDRLNEFVGRASDSVGFSTLFGQAFLGLTSIGAVSSLIGTTSSVIGDSLTNPSSLFGFLKRIENVQEGQSIYTKATGGLNLYDKTGATLLASRSISDSGSTITKS